MSDIGIFGLSMIPETTYFKKSQDFFKLRTRSHTTIDNSPRPDSKYAIILLNDLNRETQLKARISGICLIPAKSSMTPFPGSDQNNLENPWTPDRRNFRVHRNNRIKAKSMPPATKNIPFLKTCVSGRNIQKEDTTKKSSEIPKKIFKKKSGSPDLALWKCVNLSRTNGNSITVNRAFPELIS